MNECKQDGHEKCKSFFLKIICSPQVETNVALIMDGIAERYVYPQTCVPLRGNSHRA